MVLKVILHQLFCHFFFPFWRPQYASALLALTGHSEVALQGFVK